MLRALTLAGYFDFKEITVLVNLQSEGVKLSELLPCAT
jgi:hypothetical protein